MFLEPSTLLFMYCWISNDILSAIHICLNLYNLLYYDGFQLSTGKNKLYQFIMSTSPSL